jgi:thiamine kinase-like enzyme
MKEPKYKEDILHQLLHEDGTPAAIILIKHYLATIQQTMSRSTDEIESLRKEIKELKRSQSKNPRRK